MGRKTIAYNVKKNMLKYNVILDLEPELEESEPKDLETNLIEVQVPTFSEWKLKKLKKINSAKVGLLVI